MTEMEAIELVLGDEGTCECFACDGTGWVRDICLTCSGVGRLAFRELVEARKLLGLGPPDMEVYEDARNYYVD